MIRIQFKFKIGEEVRIRRGGRWGEIRAYWIGGEKKEKLYSVRYKNDVGSIIDEWFRGDELMR